MPHFHLGPSPRGRRSAQGPDRVMKTANYIYSPEGAGAQQATQDYALEASFLRIITTPAIVRPSNNQEDGSGTGWKVMLSMKATI